MEIRQEVKTYKVHYMCDDKNCGGEMQPTGLCLTSMPPLYPHTCSQCGISKNFPDTYPYIETEQMP